MIRRHEVPAQDHALALLGRAAGARIMPTGNVLDTLRQMISAAGIVLDSAYVAQLVVAAVKWRGE